MATNPTFKLSLLAFPQKWDGISITLRFLVLPQGDPRSPLLTGVPNTPAFADAKLKILAHLIPSLDALPQPSNATAQVSLVLTPPSNPRTLFQHLATQFHIVPNNPGEPPRRSGWRTRKFLPESYRNAFDFDRPRTPFALTDDTYRCMIQHPATKTKQPPPLKTVTWGRVIGFALRQPLLAQALGLLYETIVTLPSATFFSEGGWLYLGLDPTSDFSLQVAKQPDLLQPYAARIPALSAPRSLFAAVLFPVLATPPTASYDSVFVEAEDYDDGFAKIVHGAQPDRAALLDTSADGLSPSADFGIRLGWDDEQVAIWLNRQMDASEIDAPMGVAGYRIDARQNGNTAWHSLCQVHADSLILGTTNPTNLGKFNGELGVETNPLQHDPTSPQEWWLPSYFAQWRGGSMVVADADALTLHGNPNPSSGQPYVPDVQNVPPLRYGQSYDVRVRLMDLTRGGPSPGETPVNPAPAPVATIPFRRFVPFKQVTVTNLKTSPQSGPDNIEFTTTPPSATPQKEYTIMRPLLGYPDIIYTGYLPPGYPSAVAALLADLKTHPGLGHDGREASLPDPDAVTLQIDVQVRQLAMDTTTFAGTDNEPYSALYTTTLDFPHDPSKPLLLSVDFQDFPDISKFPSQPQQSNGPFLLPTARDVRLILRAIGKDDPSLAYFGSQNARIGAEIEILTRANSTDETGIFAPDIEANRIRAIMLQPDPVPTSNLVAQQALKGTPNAASSDMAFRFAQALSLSSSGLTFSALPGTRAVFGCSKGLRHTLSPDHGQITFASKGELLQQWIIAITLRLARDWSWDGLAPVSFDVRDGTGTVIGSLDVNHGLGQNALQNPDRRGTDLIFFDAVDPKPLNGQFPKELSLAYTITPNFLSPPANEDPPLPLSLNLPIAAPPTQTPKLVSAGLALSPYTPSADYSSTEARKRALWLEFVEPLDNKNDLFFARVLAYAPDPVLTGDQILQPGPAPVNPPPEPPLPIDPELIRVIVPGQSDDGASLDAMQKLIPSDDSPRHFMLPLPTGLAVDGPELFGFFVYELRIGHAIGWSTAQARFGPALRVAGVQHPAPPLLCQVNSIKDSISVSAPFATPVFAGRNLLPLPPRSVIWVLLYAQVTQADGASQRNVLLSRCLAPEPEPLFPGEIGKMMTGMGLALWDRTRIESLLSSLALPAQSPLSVLAVELLPEISPPNDPLSGDLGKTRILRASPLTPVPPVC